MNERERVLGAILTANPIPFAYRISYLANFYVEPLVRDMERTSGITRPEWIVLFCLHRHQGLTAQKISEVTGRPKTSISTAMKLLQEKNLISRTTDLRDGRRRIVEVTEAGERVYARLLRKFIVRERQMLACLRKPERARFLLLLEKLVSNSGAWTRLR